MARKTPIADAIRAFTMGSGARSVEVVGADVDRAQAQAVTGLNYLLLQGAKDFSGRKPHQNFGGRFSANALMPSLISALRMLSR